MLVTIIQTFDTPGRRWFAGENPDVDPTIAAQWVQDGKAALDITPPQQPAGGGVNTGAGLVALGIPSASANTAALQSALSQPGRVSITTPGTYYTNATIYMASNTSLHLGAGVTLRQAPGTSKPMLVTDAYSPNFLTGTTTITPANLTSSGLTATISQTGIGTAFPAGSYITLLGATQHAYNGVFRVESASANQLTYKLSRPASASPATTAGTIGVKAATINVQITGDGTIDYDVANNNAASTLYDSCAVILMSAHNSRVSGPNFTNVKKYCVWLSNIRDCISERQYYQTPSDGTHVCGPQRGYVKVQDLAGYCGDDIVGLSNGDNPTGELTRGEMDHVEVRNITGDNTLLAIVSVVGGGDYTMRYWDLTIDGVYGSTAATAVNLYEYVTGGATMHSTSIAKLTLANICATEFSDSGMMVIGGTTNGVQIDHLIIDKPRAQKTLTGQQSLAFIFAKAQVTRVSMVDPYSVHAAATTGSMLKILDTAVVGSVSIDRFEFLPGASSNNVLGTASTATVSKWMLTNGRMAGSGNLGHLAVIGGAGAGWIVNVDSSSTNDHVTISQAVAVTLNVSKWTHAGGAVTPIVGASGATITVLGDMVTSHRIAPGAGVNLRLNGATLRAAGSVVTSPVAGDQFFDTDGSVSGTAGIGVKARTNAGAWNLLY